MNAALLILVAALALVTGFLLFVIFQRGSGGKKDDSAMALLSQQMHELAKTMDAKMSESSQMLHRSLTTQFAESSKIIRDVTERLTRLDETNKQVVNFADQLQSLQDILQNPKQRGVLGEYYLETVLKNVLPPGAFRLQYAFKDGSIVDAAIIIQDKVIPVDSKFSLENYNRMTEAREKGGKEEFEKLFRQDLKNRIDETSKYVKPEEGTLDFAFMFIPSEAVFYDVLINKVGAIDAKDLIQYAFQKKVIIVSPTSFLAYLQTVLQGLRALQIEESTKEIRKRVEDLGRHIVSHETYMQKLGGHLGTTVNAYNAAYRELGKIDKDVLKITGQSGDIKAAEIQGPEKE